jgi:hypothetical protein
VSTIPAEDGTNTSMGTGAGLYAFLDYLIKRNEMVEATVAAIRTGCNKIAAVEDNFAELDLRTADVDDIVRRFRIKYRGQIKDRSISVYEQRFRHAVDMYRKWLDDDPDWRPASSRRRPASADGSSPTQNGRKAGGPAKVRESKPSTPEPDGQPDRRIGTQVPEMITYPFPIRTGLQGRITLPENLSRREAERIAAFVAALVSEDGEEHPADPQNSGPSSSTLDSSDH